MIEVFYRTMHHYFPKLSIWLNQIDDPRVKKTTYTLSHLLWTGLFMFLVKLGAKRQIKYLLSTEEFKGNLSLTSESSTHRTPYSDKIGNLLKKLSTKEISKIRHKIIARLIRMKCLTPFRLLKLHYMIAIDGTEHVTYKERHCPYLSPFLTIGMNKNRLNSPTRDIIFAPLTTSLPPYNP